MFSYDGKDAQKIELTETKLVSVTAEKKIEADKTAKDFTVELKRVVKTDDKPTKPGDKPDSLLQFIDYGILISFVLTLLFLQKVLKSHALISFISISS